MNVKNVAHILKCLTQGPVSRIELANRVGLEPKVIGRLLAELKAQKMIYVIDYTNETDGRNRVKIYTFGEGEDAPPKRTQSQEERSRKSGLRKAQKRKTFTPLTTFAGGKSLWQ